MQKRFKRLSTFQIIMLGFVLVILLGAGLLCLPIATQSRTATPFIDALFTSVSATCVTGLVAVDTATHWSAFGQAVVLVLIQIGGLGLVSIMAFMGVLAGRKISLLERSAMQDAISAHQVGGIVQLTVFVFRVVFAIEIIGAMLLLPIMVPKFGAKGIWMSLFTSISAFCNAGFDVMGSISGEFSSLTSMSANIPFNLIICALIIVGGIGFLTWDDIAQHKFRLRRYRMQSKVILATTGLLILVPSVIFFFGDFKNAPFGERLCLSVFQAVTPRTAGFNTADLSAMSALGQTIIIMLMLTGGSPGSTAGGMKTTTLAVLAANFFAVIRRKKSTLMFGRRVDDSTVRNASAILFMYLALMLVCGFIISSIENLPLGTCLFETASAVGTAGLTLGITTSLTAVSRIILMLLMFFGRVGGLTIIYATLSNNKPDASQYPIEKITVG